MQISYEIQTMDLNKDIDNLLHEIDVFIADQAKLRLYNDRFGANSCINTEDFTLLCKYKNILYYKAKGSRCFRDFNLDDIISRIKQLLNRN
jgi:hypothetical protein